MSKPMHEPEVFEKLFQTDFQKAFESCPPGTQWEARIVLLIRTLDKSNLTEEEKNNLIIACMRALRLQHKIDAADEIMAMMRDLKTEALPAPLVVSDYGIGMEAHCQAAVDNYLAAIIPHQKELGL